MTPRARKDRLEVHHDRAPEVLHHEPPATTDAPTTTGAAAGPDIPYVEPEEFGLRVSWQSEAVRVEAAEFLVATRVQESSRRRLAGLMMRLRQQRADRT